ncbi:MAG: hypothetical protein EOP81_06755 [Variovorax sp.]|nr:MAG: hypothetical protein EOP81_06755 [Variovorax sp.]
MASTLLLIARRTALALACAAPLFAAHAQTAPQPAPAPPDVQATPGADEGRKTQKVENIHVEDSGASVDEVRYGGRTQSITVQPKANVPGYQVLPDDGGRSRQGAGETSSSGNGPRVWNVLKF